MEWVVVLTTWVDGAAGLERLQPKAVFLSLQVVAWAAKPAYDPASPPTQVVNTTTHHMPLKLAQLALTPCSPGRLSLKNT